jgi:hypothetical protein
MLLILAGCGEAVPTETEAREVPKPAPRDVQTAERVPPKAAERKPAPLPPFPGAKKVDEEIDGATLRWSYETTEPPKTVIEFYRKHVGEVLFHSSDDLGERLEGRRDNWEFRIAATRDGEKTRIEIDQEEGA